LPPETRTALLQSLSADEARALADDWAFWARSEQLPPDGDWRIWLFMGGRGAGKTRAGAEWILALEGALGLGALRVAVSKS
jgi:phage terminase large subunit-like protein